DVAPVGALIRVRADLVRLHDIGPQRDELLLAAARAEGDRAVALALPVLRAEGLEGGLVPDREHEERGARVDPGPRPEVNERGMDLLELPCRAPSRLLSRVRHHREVRALDLDPGRGCGGGTGGGEDGTQGRAQLAHRGPPLSTAAVS